MRSVRVVAHDRHQQVVGRAVAREGHVRNGNVGAELQRVRRRRQHVGLLVVDRVVAVAAPEQVGVAVVAAGHEVVARLAVDRVGVIGAVERVVALAAGGDLMQHVFPGERRAVGELEFLDAVEPGHAEQVEQVELRSDELVLDEERFAGVVDRDQQVRRRAGAREGDVALRDPRAESDDVVVAPAVADQAGDDGLGIALLVVRSCRARSRGRSDRCRRRRSRS